MYFFLNAMVTLSAVVFLVAPGTELAAVAVLLMDDAGDSAQAAAMSVLIIAVGLGVRLAYWALMRGVTAAPKPGAQARRQKGPSAEYGALGRRLNVERLRLAGCLRASPRIWTFPGPLRAFPQLTIGPGDDDGPEEVHRGDQVVYVVEGEARRRSRSASGAAARSRSGT